MKTQTPSRIFPILLAVFVGMAHDAAAAITALHATHDTNARVATQVNYFVYAPVYSLRVSAHAGDLLNAAGFLEVSAVGPDRNEVFAYLAARPVGTSTRTRISSYAWQVVHDERTQGNHHMPLNLFGRYEVPSTGDYVVDLMARKTGTGRVDVEEVRPVTNNRGRIIVEHYRAYGSVAEAAALGARLLVDADRAPFNPANVFIVPDGYQSIPVATKPFLLNPGDILRIQGAATAEISDNPPVSCHDGPALYALRLLTGGDRDDRLALPTENLIGPLTRSTLQADGVWPNSTTDPGATLVPQRLFAHLQAATGSANYGCPLIRSGSNTDIVAMHFSSDVLGAQLAESRHETAPADLTFSTGAAAVELFSIEGQHQAGDVLRVQTQVQLDMISGETRAACWARIELSENGQLRYRSIFDQRFIQNSADSHKDHDSGAFAPFALYRARQSGQHRIRLIADCSATQPATMRAKSYGRHLTVDHFTTDARLAAPSDGRFKSQ
jgi:hypothetical protein